MALRRGTLSLFLPAGAAYAVLFVLPMAGLFVESFRLYVPGSIGSAADAPFTLTNYNELLTPSFAGFFLQTLRISLLASLAGILLSFPLAYWITRRVSPRWRANALGIFG
jgi:ABC-type spermidine/putrescine transport system permease subunit I